MNGDEGVWWAVCAALLAGIVGVILWALSILVMN